jgi:hypothetical protein
MPRMVSIGTKIKQLYGLCGTRDLNAFENSFVSDLYTQTQWATKTEWVTEKQIAVIDRLYERHFA